jgi:hypothetical protein
MSVNWGPLSTELVESWDVSLVFQTDDQPSLIAPALDLPIGMLKNCRIRWLLEPGTLEFRSQLYCPWAVDLRLVSLSLGSFICEMGLTVSLISQGCCEGQRASWRGSVSSCTCLHHELAMSVRGVCWASWNVQSLTGLSSWRPDMAISQPCREEKAFWKRMQIWAGEQVPVGADCWGLPGSDLRKSPPWRP